MSFVSISTRAADPPRRRRPMVFGAANDTLGQVVFGEFAPIFGEIFGQAEARESPAAGPKRAAGNEVLRAGIPVS